VNGTTILLATDLTRGRRQIKGSRTMREGLHQMRLTGRTAFHRQIKGGPMITRLRRRIEKETEIETEAAMVIVIAIMTVTAMANHITTCTPPRELL
jgi:hypothetical protein